MRSLLMLLVAAGLFTVLEAADAKVTLASKGKARMVVLVQPGATAPERRAATELAETLGKVCGGEFKVEERAKDAPRQALIIGDGPLAKECFPGVALSKLGVEEGVIRTQGQRMLLAGGRPRGTLYAVYRFLQDDLGVRWWAPWASTVPSQPTLSLPEVNRDIKPAFEMREPFWFPAFDGDWANRNLVNGQAARLTPEMGGKVIYKGFVHTFYPLVPPDTYFATHPEWYSLVGGKRTTQNAQLCLTNQELRDFVVGRVKEWLRESPDASILSLSQNDCFNPCECPNCKAIDDREGSHSGTLLDFVNYVAEKIEPEFPKVSIDTLAYQYTRQAPKTLKPRKNVIVRLCSIECNFAAPLTDPSNASFAKDMTDWSRVADRLYVWDYTTNFTDYVLPHPNWFALGPNVRFFRDHKVRGLFEQGAYQSNGSEMSEMRSWVLAQLLWNPDQDDSKLIDEFLAGYYGAPAAKPIRAYLDLMHKATGSTYVGCFARPEGPQFSYPVMAQAEKLWQEAEAAAKDNPDLLWRVKQGHLPVRTAWMIRWTDLRKEQKADATSAPWPVSPSRKAVADEWLATATGPGPSGWAPMTHVDEGGLTPQAFAARFATDPAE